MSGYVSICLWCLSGYVSICFSYLAFCIEFNSFIQDFTTSLYSKSSESYSSVLIESTVYSTHNINVIEQVLVSYKSLLYKELSTKLDGSFSCLLDLFSCTGLSTKDETSVFLYSWFPAANLFLLRPNLTIHQ